MSGIGSIGPKLYGYKTELIYQLKPKMDSRHVLVYEWEPKISFKPDFKRLAPHIPIYIPTIRFS